MRHSFYSRQSYIFICKRVSTLLSFIVNLYYRPSYGYIVEADSGTLAPVHSRQVSASFTYHSFSMDEYWDDFLFIGVNGNAIELYGIEHSTQSYHSRVTIKDMGSQNYMAQGRSNYNGFAWHMYAYGSAGKVIILYNYI
jgi:hypothetical protein